MSEHPSEPPPPVLPAPDVNGEAPPADGGREEVPPGLTHQLRFEQFKHVATLSIAAAGGTLALLQAGYIESGGKSGSAVALFAVAAALAVLGQDKLVDGLEAGRGRTRAARVFHGVSLAVLGAGVGVLLQLVL